MKIGGQIPWNVTLICETSQICYLMKRRPMRDVFGKPFKGPIIPLGSLVEYHPITAKDQSRIHQFGKKVLPGLFFGYVLYAGGTWKDDVLVADLEELERWTHRTSTQKDSMRKKWYFPKKKDNFIFRESGLGAAALILWSRVCESMSNVDRTRTHAAVSAVAAAEQQPEGWRFVPNTILLGYQWAPQWVAARTPTVHWGPISGKAVGGPNTVQHSSIVQKHGKHGSGALAARALLTRVCCFTADPETKKSMRWSTRTSMRKSATTTVASLSCWKWECSKLSMRKRKWSTRSRSPWRMEHEASRSVSRRQTKTTCHSSINAEMLTIAARTHAVWVYVDGVSLLSEGC